MFQCNDATPAAALTVRDSANIYYWHCLEKPHRLYPNMTLRPRGVCVLGGRFVQQNSLFNLIINTSLKWSDENLKQNDFNAPLKGFVLKAPVYHTATSIYACH